MKTVLSVKFALVPLIVCWVLLAYTAPGTALATGLGLALAGDAWRLSRREITSLEIGVVTILLLLGLAYAIAPSGIGPNLLSLSEAGLGLTALVTVAVGKPWTAAYSRSSFKNESESPIFRSVNMLISGVWGGIFLLLALAHVLRVSAVVPAGIVIIGVLVSIFGPRELVRSAIRRAIAAREPYRWPAPDFAGSIGERQVDADVVVIGAGIGGLTAAALLADAGLKVVVAEHHVVPGGFCHTFLRKAHSGGKPCIYRFDAGPHDFSGLWPGGPIDSVLQRLGVADRLTWLHIPHTYQVAGSTLEVPRDWHDYVRELGRRFPASAAGFESLFSDIRAIFDGMYATGAGNTGIPGLPSDIDSMLAFPRQHPLAFRWMERPFDELVKQHIADPQARSVLATLTGYISDGSEVLTCQQMVPLFGYYFHGGFYPAGGSGRLADALVDAIEERGGEVRLKTGVAKIVVEHGRAAGVVLRDGTRIRATAVVSNADLKRTFLELVEQHHLPADFRARVAGAAPACSAFMVHLGVDYVPDVRPTVYAKGDLHALVETLSLVDPTAAPPGHSIVSIITLMPHEQSERWFPAAGDVDWKEWRRSAEYTDRKAAFGDRLIAAAETVIPDLSSHIVYRTDASPVTYARYDWSSDGAIYGISSAGRLRGSKTPIPGLVIAGSAANGPGVEPAVISGARAAAALVPGVLARKGAPAARLLAAS
ncbi:MAG: NAD(P)/FAD-dependent oxidoreductase [Candidatus Velthaea sp.]